jgi:hypothetical protein
MNPAPDADLHSVGEFYHNWVTRAVTDLVFRRLEQPVENVRYSWDSLLAARNGGNAVRELVSAVANAAEQAGRTIVPAPIQEIGQDIVTGVGSIVSEAAASVSQIVDSVVAPSKAPRTKKSATPKSPTKRSSPKKSSIAKSDKPEA